MAVPTLNYVSCPDSGKGHRMAWWEWGDPSAAHVVVCVHGLARQGRDFDVLARALVERAGHPLRVASADVVGRGRSDWLEDPMGYVIPAYVSDMLHMLGALHARAPIGRLDWVGTSMGGVIGMGVAGTPGLPLPAPIRRLVLNDVGPVIEWQAIQRIGTYLGNTGRFESVRQAADALLAISTSFGYHTPEQWMALSQHMVRQLPDGAWTIHYDPAIAVPFRSLTEEASTQGQAALWQAYDNIQARTLLTRGALSDLLSRETALEMTQRGPKAQLAEFEGVGHAPTFVQDNQVEAVAAFLFAPDADDEKPLGGAS